MQKALFVMAAALSLGACAGISTTPSNSKTATPGVDTDTIKVATVNQWAQDKGATVVWIHYPTRSKSAADDHGSTQ